jgi:hypothetical protein
MTRLVSLSSRATIHAHVLFRDLQGELVVLEPRRGVYFGLDAIGTRIWHLLQEPRPLTDVVVALVTEYEVDEAQAAADVLDLVRQLQEQGLVDVGD